MKMRFQWRALVPEGQEPHGVAERLQSAMNRAMGLDIHLAHGAVLFDEQYVLFEFDYDSIGRKDRWWIQQRAKWAMVAFTTRAKVSARTVELIGMETLPNKHSLRKPERNPNIGAKTKQRRWEEWQAFRGRAPGASGP